MSKTATNRVDDQLCYLLTSYPWRESSLWLEVLSKDHGRVSLLARSARKPNSVLRGVLMPFAPIDLSWYGKNELRTLHTALWKGAVPQPAGKNLLSSLYVNELLVKLTARDDPLTELFDEYDKLIKILCFNQPAYQAMRLFEWRLLTLLGYAPDMTQDDKGLPIDPEQIYLIQTEQSPSRYNHGFQPEQSVLVQGNSLIDLTHFTVQSPQTRSDILNLNRLLLNFRVPEGLSSRRVLNQMTSSLFD